MSRISGLTWALLLGLLVAGTAVHATAQVVNWGPHGFDGRQDELRWTNERPAQPMIIPGAPVTVLQPAAHAGPRSSARMIITPHDDLRLDSDWIPTPSNSNFFRTFHDRPFHFSSATQPATERSWDADACGPCRDIWVGLCREGTCCGEFGVAALDWIRRLNPRLR